MRMRYGSPQIQAFGNMRLKIRRALFLNVLRHYHLFKKHVYRGEFYIHGSVDRDPILIRSNEMQQYAGVYLLQNYSTCFRWLSHPSSGVHQTVTAASGTGHSVRAKPSASVAKLGHNGGRLLH